jgi:predicted ester cyclase
MTAFNAKDMNKFLSNPAPNVELSGPGGVTVRGRDQVRESVQALWNVFPNAEFARITQIATEDRAATEMVFTGTHTGPLITPEGPIPPTGRCVSLRQVAMTPRSE